MLLYLDNRATCDGPLNQCPTLYDTKVLGYVLLGAGAASLGASTYQFLNESSTPSAFRVTSLSLQAVAESAGPAGNGNLA